MFDVVHLGGVLAIVGSTLGSIMFLVWVLGFGIPKRYLTDGFGTVSIGLLFASLCSGSVFGEIVDGRSLARFTEGCLANGGTHVERYDDSQFQCRNTTSGQRIFLPSGERS